MTTPSTPSEQGTPSDRVRLDGTHRAPAPGARRVGPTASAEPIEVTVRLRGRPDVDLAAMAARPRSPEEVAAAFASDPADAEAVARFARDAGLSVVASEPEQRRVVLSGTADQLQQAFAVQLSDFDSDLGRYRGREGSVHLPPAVAEVVTGVFGLDDRRQARPHFVRRPGQSGAGQAAVRATRQEASYSPVRLGEIYDFPPGDGAGQTIAILEFGGGYSTKDLRTYFTQLGVANPSVTNVSVDGQTNQPEPGDDSPDGEVMLDIEVVGALCPAAKIVVYFAPFTERGWVDVVTRVATDTQNSPSALSISWGWPEQEDLWTPAALTAVNESFQAAAAAGITVFAASGDDGSADEITDGRVHVDFPAVSPYVSGVGGTTLTSATPVREHVWNNGPRSGGGGASGGGVSTFFSLPDWQQHAHVPNPVGATTTGRGVPDVAADADPASGYEVYVHGKPAVIGGTSAAAPLWAALIGRINATLGRRVGYLNPVLYQTLATQKVTHDVKRGSNDTTGQLGGYPARAGWDACTGWGSPKGSAILTALQSASD